MEPYSSHDGSNNPLYVFAPQIVIIQIPPSERGQIVRHTIPVIFTRKPVNLMNITCSQTPSSRKWLHDFFKYLSTPISTQIFDEYD